MGYPLVNIINSTAFNVSGTVDYESAFCSNDKYSVTPGTSWTASSRGVCLVTHVNATVQTPNGNIVAQSYNSSGTSYSQFAVIQTSPTSFEVTRRVSMAEAEHDKPPADYVEPTVQQK